MKSIKINELFTLAAFFAMLMMTACGGSSGEYEETESEEPTEETTASEMEEESPYSGETAIGVVHNVEDYETWYAAYDKDSDPKSRIGIFLGVEDPSLLVVFQFTTSHEDAKKEFASEDLKNVMKEAGVSSEPVFTYYDMKYLNQDNPSGQYRVGISHEVKDFDTWKEAFDKDEGRRSEAGLTLAGMATDSENSNVVYIMFATDDLEAVKGMLENPDIKKVMEEAGVVSEPTVQFWKVPESN